MLPRRIALVCVAVLVVCALLALDALAGKGSKKPKPPPDPVTNPAWVYCGGRHGPRNLFLATADGVDTFPVTNNHPRRGPRLSRPTWSPDGTRIAYLDHSADYVLVYTIEPDGSNSALVRGFAASDPRPPGGRLFGHLTWAPNGTEIVFATTTYQGDPHVWSVDTSTGALRGLVPEWRGPVSGASFSPDLDAGTPGYQGKMIYDAEVATNTFGFVVRDAWIDASGRLQVSASDQAIPPPGDVGELLCPVWSPDGAYVACITSPDYRVMVAHAAVLGSGDVELTDHRHLAPGEGATSAPTWSPDSQYVTFTAYDGLVYRVRVDGTGLTSVLGGDWPDWNPNWVNDLD